MKHLLDVYSDYLLASFSQTSATGLSNLPIKTHRSIASLRKVKN